MSKSNTLETLFNHNLWANQQLLECCIDLTDDQLKASVIGTYGSIQETLEHIVGSEQAYFIRISTGKQYRRPPDPPAWTIKEMEDLLQESGQGLIEWAEKVEGNDTVLLDWDGTQREVPKTIILTQAINHATEHRAQILTILTQLKISPPDLSSWTYFDKQI